MVWTVNTIRATTQVMGRVTLQGPVIRMRTKQRQLLTSVQEHMRYMKKEDTKKSPAVEHSYEKQASHFI